MPEDEKCARAIKKHRFKLPKPNAQQRLQKKRFPTLQNQANQQRP